MNHLNTVELLEDTHAFPGPYIFKVIGRSEGGFVARTVAAIREELEASTDPPFRVRETAGGRHVAVTIEPRVQSAWDVIAVYNRLSLLSGLVMIF